MIWRRYRNCQLAFHVEQRNQHNKIVNELASACTNALTEFRGQGILKAGGGIRKKVKDRLDSALNALHPFTNSLQWMVRATERRVYLWVKSCYQREGQVFYIQDEVCVGELVGNHSLYSTLTYAPPREATLLETNFDAETVLAALNEIDGIEDKLNKLKNHFSDFITQRD